MAIVPIIIPFYKEHDKLRNCRAAIDAQTQPGCETFVRDNTHDNILFTAAVNEGLAKYCYRDDVEFVMVLNQDAYMQKDCVRRLLEFMKAHPDSGIACPIQYAEAEGGPRGPMQTLGQRRVTWGGSYQAFPFGVHQKDDLASYKAPFETYWANGACMMIRVATIRECGLLDRNMRFICSDSDFSFTVRARGWKVHVVPDALCEHSLGASGGASNLAIQAVKVRDAMYFTQKWLSGGLYRQLAFEGPQLTHIGVRETLRRCQSDLEELERALGQHAASDERTLYSLLKHFYLPRRTGPFS
jgi:GT2 family glycosyltransferase